MGTEAASLLLQAMAGGQMQNSQALIEEYLARRSADDPRVAMLMEWMSRQRMAAEEEHADEIPDLPPAASEPARLPDHEKRQEVKEKIAALCYELRTLRQHNRMFAEAVGACPQCWGGDPACEICHGAGKPGGHPIDFSLFAELVAPAVVQYQRSLRPQGPAPRGPNPRPIANHPNPT